MSAGRTNAVQGSTPSLATLNIRSGGSSSRPHYWSITFVDSDGIAHLSEREGTYSINRNSMLYATAGTAFAQFSGAVPIQNNTLYQAMGSVVEFYFNAN